MSFQNAVQQRLPEPVSPSWDDMPHRDAPHCCILGDTRNRSRRRLNWFNWFAALTLLAAAVAAIMEAM